MRSNCRYKVGSRGSKLAKVQTDIVLQSLKECYPDLQDIERIWITTTGDSVKDCALCDIGGKALFTKEIELALLNKQIDFAVHSLKDMEWRQNPDLTIVAVLPREDDRDVLIVRSKLPGDERGGTESVLGLLQENAVVGTCAPRRAAQLLNNRPDLKVVPLRGNINSRLQKLQQSKDPVAAQNMKAAGNIDAAESMDAIVLALAGLKRLGVWCPDSDNINIEGLSATIIPCDVMLPAAGQGALAVQCRRDDLNTINLLQKINHQSSFICAIAEREVLRLVNGDCHTAIAVRAEIIERQSFPTVAEADNQEIKIRACFFPNFNPPKFNFLNKRSIVVTGDVSAIPDLCLQVANNLLSV